MFLSAGEPSKAVEDVDHLAEAAVIATVKAEGDAGQVEVGLVLTFFRGRLNGLDFFARDDAGKVLVQRIDSGLGGRVLEANDQEFVDETHRMIVAIETGDDADRFVDVVCDAIEIEIVWGDETVAEEVFANVFIPGLPISATGAVHKDERHHAALAG